MTKFRFNDRSGLKTGGYSGNIWLRISKMLTVKSKMFPIKS